MEQEREAQEGNEDGMEKRKSRIGDGFMAEKRPIQFLQMLQSKFDKYYVLYRIQFLKLQYCSEFVKVVHGI